MKINANWLRELTNISSDINTEIIAEQLTMAGLEVDEITNATPDFSGVIIGEIIEAKQHPDADRLRVCTVNIGQTENLNIVCGAANARSGLKVAVATVGAMLPNNFAIKKAKLRGVESYGMLCSVSELGIAETSNGIMELPFDAPIGVDIRKYLQLDDQILTIELTPNRGDCLSALGLARELAAINRVSLNAIQIADYPQSQDSFAVNIIAKKQCPHYACCLIKNISNTKSPFWLIEKLRRCGLRSINPVVDVTNYVMLELGQPLHAFDLNKIGDSIEIRLAKSNEEILLLDGKKIALDDNTLVIADKNKVLAIAGVMGGLESAVDENTTAILIESAFFAPNELRGCARRYGLQTDSSYRFERGVDSQLQIKALKRAIYLLLEIVKGEAGAINEINSPEIISHKHIEFNIAKVASLLGEDIDEAEISDIFKRLGIEIISKKNNVWLVKIPSYRFDLTIAEDLVEEIARIYGYDRLPQREIISLLSGKAVVQNQSNRMQRRLKEIMLDRGYHEAITYSFIDPVMQKYFNSEIEPLKLANPISPELSVMRTSLIPGLIKALQYNQSHKTLRVRLFEIGLCFFDASHQLPFIAGVASGEVMPEQLDKQNNPIDFFALKGDVEALLKNYIDRKNLLFKPEETSVLHPKRSARIYVQNIPMGWVGELHPALKKVLEISTPLCVFELNLSLVKNEIKPEFKEVSKFPEMQRDLAIVVDKNVTWQAIKEKVILCADNLLQNIQIFDIFTGVGIDVSEKSIALHLTFQHLSRTLVEDEVEKVMQRITSVLQSDFNARLR